LGKVIEFKLKILIINFHLIKYLPKSLSIYPPTFPADIEHTVIIAKLSERMNQWRLRGSGIFHRGGNYRTSGFAKS